MSTGELLSVEPQELQFPFELKKQISCSMQLTNKTSDHVAFKVKTTNPKKYCVRPNTGVVSPHSTCDVVVTMQAQKEAPPDMQCKDKFLLQSVVASPGAAPKDITPELFNKESGNHVEECKLRVNYVAPPQPPSPVREGSEEGSSPRASISDNGTGNVSDSNVVSRAYAEPQDNSSEASRVHFELLEHLEHKVYPPRLLVQYERYLIIGILVCGEFLILVVANGLTARQARAMISKLTEERNHVIQQNNKISQELELLRRQGSRSRGGVSFIYLLLVGLLGILLGYIMKKT